MQVIVGSDQWLRIFLLGETQRTGSLWAGFFVEMDETKRAQVPPSEILLHSLLPNDRLWPCVRMS